MIFYNTAINLRKRILLFVSLPIFSLEDNKKYSKHLVVYLDKNLCTDPRETRVYWSLPFLDTLWYCTQWKLIYKSSIVECTFILSAQDNLDASTSSDQSESSTEAFSDPVHGLHASKPKDFVIFINLVDFCRYTSYFSLYLHLGVLDDSLPTIP